MIIDPAVAVAYALPSILCFWKGGHKEKELEEKVAHLRKLLDECQSKCKEMETINHDKWLMDKLENGNCPDFESEESFKKQISELSKRNPERQVYIDSWMKKCIEKKSWSFADIEKWVGRIATMKQLKEGTLDLLGQKKDQSSFAEMNKWHEAQKVIREQQDAYVFQQLEKENCEEGITDLKKFQEIVQETFARDPAKAVWHGEQYKTCLEKASKSISQKPST